MILIGSNGVQEAEDNVPRPKTAPSACQRLDIRFHDPGGRDGHWTAVKNRCEPNR